MRDCRSSTRSALTLGAAFATALVWSGCDAKKQTEYVAGVSTQVQVPRDLKSIRIDVSVGGVVQFCRGYRAYDGKVILPKSLGELPSQGTPGPEPITVPKSPRSSVSKTSAHAAAVKRTGRSLAGPKTAGRSIVHTSRTATSGERNCAQSCVACAGSRGRFLVTSETT